LDRYRLRWPQGLRAILETYLRSKVCRLLVPAGWVRGCGAAGGPPKIRGDLQIGPCLESPSIRQGPFFLGDLCRLSIAPPWWVRLMRDELGTAPARGPVSQTPNLGRYAPSARYWICPASRKASNVSSILRRTVDWAGVIANWMTRLISRARLSSTVPLTLDPPNLGSRVRVSELQSSGEAWARHDGKRS
jgi:hypothetical protein